MVNAEGSKPLGETLAGSSPVLGTKFYGGNDYADFSV